MVTSQPSWNEVLRELRRARGVSQDGWATRLGYSRRTLQRWEQGDAVPDETGEAVIVAFCSEQGLFHTYDRGALSGVTVTAAWLQEILAAARLGQPGQTTPPAAIMTSVTRANVPPSSSPAPQGGPSLPTGTLTFLFTDVEGSTHLWEQHPQDMRRVMARHDALLSGVFEQHDGVVVRPRGEGDSLFVVFERASDAVAGALAAQRALLAEVWSDVGPLRVRMGLHTGEADLREGDYYGSAVNRTARIRAAGHGGQVLISQATAQLARAALPEGIALLDMDRHRLKDLSEPEQLFQLLAPGLPDAFPALKTLDSQPDNLPNTLTSFVGREQEAEEITRLLGATRLLTLTGPGGIGKTRLAIEVARSVARHFTDGVFFVDLSSVSDPALVIARIAQTLGVRGLEAERLADSVQAFLRDKDLLLVLDNFEQVVDAAPRVLELVSACRYVQALITSRTLLRVQGEQEFAVPPLPVPDGDRSPSVAELMLYASVQLFVERAKRANPGFAITSQDAQDVMGICLRLDGLPLAIELAAARIKVLAPRAMLTRLQNRLKLLTGGSRDLPARQQTLRAAIDWSYDLLDHTEQTLFRRLAAFVGGWTLAAAEAVCVLPDGPDLDVLDGLASLIDNSLVRRVEGEDGEPRFRLFETIREYALERLAESDEAQAIRMRHATHYLALAERARLHLGGPRQPAWLAQFDAEHDNLRVAFRAWVELGELAQAVRMARALEWFWVVRGHTAEGRALLSNVLDAPAASERSMVRAETLSTAGTMAMHQLDFTTARGLFAESLDIRREVGSDETIGELLQSLGTAAGATGDHAAARAYLEESLQVYRNHGDSRGVAQLLNDLANTAHAQRDFAAARSMYEQSLAIWRDLDGPVQAAFVLNNWGVVVKDEGDYTGARALFEESAAIHREVGEPRGLAVSIASLARLAMIQAEYPRTEMLLAELLLIRYELGDTGGIAAALDRFAAVAAAQAQAERSLRLAGAAGALRDISATAPSPDAWAQLQQQLAPMRQRLGEAASTASWAAGRALSLREAIDYALAYAELSLPTEVASSAARDTSIEQVARASTRPVLSCVDDLRRCPGVRA